eukprot:gene15047-20246_t
MSLKSNSWITNKRVITNSSKNNEKNGTVEETTSNLRGHREGILIVTGSSNDKSGSWKTLHSGQTQNEGDISPPQKCELKIINELDHPVLLCWISYNGELKNFYPINDCSIRDGSVSNSHVEFTYTTHSFVCIKPCEKLPAKISDVTKESFLLTYTPYKGSFRHIITLKKEEKVAKKRFFWSKPKKYETISPTLDMKPCTSKDEIIFTADKPYEQCVIHGFTVNYEKGVFEKVTHFDQILSEDIYQLTCLLPKTACEKLQQNTQFWINKSFTYGTLSEPIIATTCTFHPIGGKEWLRNMGMNESKEGGIEIYSAQEYINSRHHWGPGGVLVHEFSHAFHNKHCPDGYNCYEIREAYTKAMECKLYDSVPVHGPQGANGTAKAYACTNCMEFFAELSVAYHWIADESTEYNKWFPYNRHQLIKHDPETFALLDSLWMNPIDVYGHEEKADMILNADNNNNEI